jgi:hypothetical protein
MCLEDKMNIVQYKKKYIYPTDCLQLTNLLWTYFNETIKNIL